MILKDTTEGLKNVTGFPVNITNLNPSKNVPHVLSTFVDSVNTPEDVREIPESPSEFLR